MPLPLFHPCTEQYRAVVRATVGLCLMLCILMPRGTLAAEKQPDTGPLSFPGKVYAHAPSNRLFIADSNHNRIVVADLSGQVLDVAGSGAIGNANGPFATATFNHPQGMSLDGNVLYVADTENHLIRRLDLRARTVTTIAGSETRARQTNMPGAALQAALNAPWDLLRLETQLFIAIAGSHQVWVLHLETGITEPYAGSGREALVDGPRQQAALAQPRGITSDGSRLFVADSETSAIRVIGLGPEGTVDTVVGQGLFAFGDQDGTGKENVRLQHPLGIAYADGVLYLADTENHKIKKIDPQTITSVTYLGTGQPGQRDGSDPEFDEPGGISVAAGQLYIADTNNHAIRVAALSTGNVSTLRLRGLTAPAALAGFRETRFSPEESIKVAPQQVRAGQPGAVTVHLKLPAGYHLNPHAPFTYRVDVRGEGIAVREEHQRFQDTAPPLPLRIPFQTVTGTHQATLDIDMTFSFCREDNTGVCAIQSVRWHVPLHTVVDGSTVAPMVSYTPTVPALH